MREKVSRIVEQFRFDRAIKNIVETPPLHTTSGALKFVSMLQHKDVYAYLLSIKSVYRSFGEGQIFIVSDGSLTHDDELILKEQLGNPEIRHMDDVYNPNCPKGGTWERLLTIIDESKDSYVIQVDADLVACGPLQDPVAHYRAGHSFALGNLRSPGHATFVEMSNWIQNESGFSDHPHIQVAAENFLKEMKKPSERFYVRGTSAFAGFPKGAVSRSQVEEFSQECEEHFQERWTEWGTEQITSNYAVANAPGAHELKAPYYVNHQPGALLDEAKLVHFFGTHRYKLGNYRSIGQAVIRDLMA